MTDFLSTNELAERLKFHPETIRRLVRRSEIPAMRIGNKNRYDFDEVVKSLKINESKDN